MKQLAKLLSLLVLVYLLSAATAQASCKAKHCDGLIERINLWNNVLQVVMVDDMSPLLCNLALTEGYLTIEVNRPSFREMHGMLLGAMLSARPVLLRLEENDSVPCEIKYVSLGK